MRTCLFFYMHVRVAWIRRLYSLFANSSEAVPSSVQTLDTGGRKIGRYRKTIDRTTCVRNTRVQQTALYDLPRPRLAKPCLNHPVITMVGRPEPITPWIFIDLPGLWGFAMRHPINRHVVTFSLRFREDSTFMCDVTSMIASFHDSKYRMLGPTNKGKYTDPLNRLESGF